MQTTASLLSLSSNLITLFLLILSLSSSTTLFTISILQRTCMLKVALPSYFIVYFQSYVTFRHTENFNSLCIVFYCSHSMHQVTTQRIENLNGLCIVFYCSHFAHQVTTRCIENLNGLCIILYCTHSMHQVTTRRIIRLPTSVGSPQLPSEAKHRRVL